MIIAVVHISILAIMVTIAAAGHHCQNPTNPQYTNMKILNKGTWAKTTNCYFEVKSASFRKLVPGSEKLESPRYTIDLDEGRRICYKHRATLPIILTEAEQEFLNRKYAGVAHFMLLGLERITYDDWIWDNIHGTGMYHTSNWQKIKEHTTGTYTMLMTNDGRWSEFYPNRTWPKKNKFPVICQQRAYGENDTNMPGELGHWHPRDRQDADDGGENRAMGRVTRDLHGANGGQRSMVVEKYSVILSILSSIMIFGTVKI